jgi:hypothetical protein
MPTTPATGEAIVERSVDEQFLDLICGDAELLAAEFDAIIAADWHTPPADRLGCSAAGGHPSDRAARRGADPARGLASRPRHPGVGGWARQRSPPPRQPSTSDRKAGDRHT